MIENFIFGCAHLYGGAGQKTTNALVALCLDAGVDWFDTAPLYGIGTAEIALARALALDGRPAKVSIKIGLRRPSFGMGMTYLREAKRKLGLVLPKGANQVSRQIPSPPIELDLYLLRGRLNGTEIFRVFSESHERLKIAQVQAVFLHEAYANNLGVDAIQALDAMKKEGACNAIGIANGCVHDEQLDKLVPPNFLIQAACPPSMFGKKSVYKKSQVFHSIIKSFLWRLSVDAEFRWAAKETLEYCVDILGNGSNARIVLAYILTELAAPESKIIYATSNPDRLENFLEKTLSLSCSTKETVVESFLNYFELANHQSGKVLIV
jgi:hypothetical protein